jgi:transposase
LLFEASLLVEKLKQVRQQIEETQNLIEDVSNDFAEYSWLLTIPGFGPYISARVLASIDSPWRFDNPKQLLKLVGYDYFTKLLRGRERECGIKTKMRVKLAAKMLVIAWTLMKKQETFDPHLLNID